MTRRVNPQLAFGDYVSRNSELSEACWRARVAVVEGTRTSCPEFLKRLASDTLPAFQTMKKAGFRFDHILWGGQSPFLSLPGDSELKSALLGWAEQFNANLLDGLLDDAVRTLWYWDTQPQALIDLSWFKQHSAEIVFVGKKFRFTFSSWEPQGETWEQYTALAHKSFAKALERYQSRTRHRAEAAGLVRVSRSYEPENFQWFGQYQFCGLSSTQIAGKARKNESTILKGIKATERLTGWVRRSPGSRKNRKSQ